ncbi:hypothetical protein ACNS7O_01490 [Haloferacaceae archaeon DSL9]
MPVDSLEIAVVAVVALVAAGLLAAVGLLPDPSMTVVFVGTMVGTFILVRYLRDRNA